MNFFVLLQIAIKTDLRHWTGKAGLWHGAAMSRQTDSIVDISMQACDAAIADLQMHLDALSAITKAAANAHWAGTVLNVAQAMSADA